MKPTLAILAVFFAISATVRAQSSPSTKRSSTSTDPPKTELQDVKAGADGEGSTLNLKAAGPLSPEEAARATAKSLARQKDGPSGSESEDSKDRPVQRDAVDAHRDVTNDAVVEFRPAASGAEKSSSEAVVQKEGKSRLKKVHGELYGAKSGVGHADGGSVGATTKGGKTSVYVESSQSRSAIPGAQ